MCRKNKSKILRMRTCSRVLNHLSKNLFQSKMELHSIKNQNLNKVKYLIKIKVNLIQRFK